MLVINLETGDTEDVDEIALLEYGLLEGYRVADSITTEEWIEALQKALK